MSKHAAVLLALALAGCTEPAITSASRDSVTLRYEPILFSREQAQAQATEQCQTYYGDTSGAVFISSSHQGPLGYRFDTFNCTIPPQAMTPVALPPSPFTTPAATP